MKMRFWNFQFGNNKKNKKAFVFTLDAFLALLITILILSASAVYLVKGKNTIPYSQTTRIGSDIVTLLENKGTLDSLDENTIENDLNNILPNRYGMRINVTWDDVNLLQTNSIEFGDELPTSKFIATGKRFFITENSGEVENYAFAKYWIWLK